jgi:general secretion pathway protein A
MGFLNFFGLKEDPFTLTPDPAYFYPSSGHNEGLLLMDYSIDQREGFLLVTGDPGTGKTTLLNVFLAKWKSNAEIAIVLTPRLSPEEFLTAVADDLSIDIDNKNKNEIIKALRDFMSHKSAEGTRVIIIVDEAQNLPDDTLEELRLLSNLETDKDKLLQIMLIGQPELEAKLRTDKLRQLNQRITTRIRLKQFSPDETLDYINFRAIKAGKKNLQIHNNASRLAYKRTKGIPRLINMLLSRALMAAYVEENNVILPRHIHHAMKSLGHDDMKRHIWHGLPRAAAGILSVFFIGMLVFFLFHYIMSDDGEGPLKAKRSVQKDENIYITGEAPNPAYKVVQVNVNVALVRKDPSVDSKKAGWSSKGDQLIVLNESTDDRNIKWYQIPFQGSMRWISEEVVEEVRLDGEANQKAS